MFRGEISDFSSFAPQPMRLPVPLSLGDWLKRLWRVRFWAIGGAFGLSLLAFGAVQVLPPSYRASAQVFIDPQNLQLLERDLSPSTSSGDAGVVLIESQARVMMSQSVLRGVVAQLHLDSDPEFTGPGNPLKVFLETLLNGAPDPAVDDTQRAMTALSKAVYVVRLDRTYVVDIHAESESAGKAADIANAVVAQYLALRDSQRSHQAETASGELSGRLGQLMAELQAAETAVERFKSQNNIVTIGNQSLLENAVAQSSQVALSAQNALDQARTDLAQIASLADDPEKTAALPEAFSSAELAQARTELQAAASALAVLRASLGDRHPRVQAAQQRLEEARVALKGEIARLQARAQLALDRAQQTAEQAAQKFGGLTSDLQHADALSITLRQLQRQADAIRAIYEGALLRSRETAEQAQVDTLNAQVVSQAMPPASRSFPPKPSVLLPLAFGLGLLLGAAAGLGLDRLRRKEDQHA